THIWQDNNHQPVVNDGGRRVTTDRNLILKPVGGDMPLNDDDLKRIYEAVWLGKSGAKMIPVRQPGKPDGWPEYALGSATDWIIRQQLDPMREQLSSLANAVAKQQGITADEIADALRPGLVSDILPVVQEVVADALGEDSDSRASDIANLVVDKISRRLAGDGE